jgi:alpha-L-arabinofuranosidase
METGKWYEVKMVFAGDRVECYLDGQKKESAEVLHRKVPGLFASAVRDDRTGETVLKVVNPGDKAERVAVAVAGGAAASRGRLTVFGGENAQEDTFENPRATAPKEMEIGGIGKAFEHVFPARSMSVLRVRTGNK